MPRTVVTARSTTTPNIHSVGLQRSHTLSEAESYVLPLLIFPYLDTFKQSNRLDLNTLGLPKSAPASEKDEPQSCPEPIVLELLDAWRRRQPDHPSRAEAIERLIAIGWAPEIRRWI
jgi:hypothetical protein